MYEKFIDFVSKVALANSEIKEIVDGFYLVKNSSCVDKHKFLDVYSSRVNVAKEKLNQEVSDDENTLLIKQLTQIIINFKNSKEKQIQITIIKKHNNKTAVLFSDIKFTKFFGAVS